MNLFTSRLLTICGLIRTALLFQIMISSNLVVAIESSESNTNKISSGSELESIVTNGSSTNQLAYRNSQHGIFMLFPSNWTFSNSGLPEYTQVAAFYGPLQNLSDPIPPRLTITVMNYQQNVSLKDFTNMTLSSLNQTNQVKILSSEPTTLSWPSWLSSCFFNVTKYRKSCFLRDNALMDIYGQKDLCTPI